MRHETPKSSKMPGGVQKCEAVETKHDLVPHGSPYGLRFSSGQIRFVMPSAVCLAPSFLPDLVREASKRMVPGVSGALQLNCGPSALLFKNSDL